MNNIAKNQCQANKANKSVECSVENCAHHCPGDKFCALERIEVGADTLAPKNISATNCSSFRASCK